MGRSPECPFPFAPCPTPVEQAREAIEEEQALPIPQTRRKSSTWKGFSLKRQLSKVDIKLRNPLKEKRGSIFYGDTLPDQYITDAVDDLEDSSPASDDSTIIDNQSVIDLTMKNGNRTTKSSEDVAEIIQFSPEDETEVPLIVGSLGSQLNYLNRKASCATRPDNLNLFSTDDPPIKPPRTKKKTKEQRELRLLSVPNIKFMKFDQQSFKDLRDREETAVVSPQPSFTGSFIRRFSKF